MAAQIRVLNRSPRTPDLLGGRIRKARLELGLSLAAVAQTDFSRAFLNQVELGRARPSTRNLQIIAERLRRPVEQRHWNSGWRRPEHESARATENGRAR